MLKSIIWTNYSMTSLLGSYFLLNFHFFLTYLCSDNIRIFMHRYRDIFPTIRAECITALGEWVREYKLVFLADKYLKYLGWTLSDKVTYPILPMVACFANIFIRWERWDSARCVHWVQSIMSSHSYQTSSSSPATSRTEWLAAVSTRNPMWRLLLSSWFPPLLSA